MALSQSEIFEHIGRMLWYGINNRVTQNQNRFDKQIAQLVRVAKDYRLNGTNGTQAERAEAMRTAFRKLFEKVSGLDATVNSHQLFHFIEDLEPGDGSLYE